MTLDQARAVCLPFGRYRGWPLGSVARKDAGYLRFLAKMAFYGELREAVATLAGLDKRDRRTAAINRRRVDAWAWR